jgi:hypothetical protein
MTPFARIVSPAAFAVMALVVSGPAAPLHAQTAQTLPPGAAEAPPGHLGSVEGEVVLERSNQSEDLVSGMPLLVGDRIRADSGKAEVMWGEGLLIKVARYTDLDVLSKSMLRVTRGRVSVTIPNLPGMVVSDQLSIDAPSASVRFYAAGIYHVLVTGDDVPEVQLGVTHGSAQLISDGGQMQLADAESSEVKGGGTPSPAEHFLASVADSTYDPSADLAVFRGEAGTGNGYASTEYLPENLYGYEDVLQSNGTWSSVPSYGYVWFPRVSNGWRPYSHGRWSYLPRYGWTWVGYDRWAWPTHYYGRWGVTNAGAWYWIPSRQWGPAWVAWSISPDYVGWCPLGWNGRPVYSFNGTVTATTGSNFRGSESFRGWTVVNSRYLGSREWSRHAVDRTIISRDRPVFVTQYTPPRAPTYIVERGSTGRRGGSGSGGGSDRGDRGERGERDRDRANTNANVGLTTGAVQRGSANVPADPPPAGYVSPYNGVVRPPQEESPYDRALRVMGRRTREQDAQPAHGGDERNRNGASLRTGRPDGMSRDDNRDPGGNDGRSTVAPVIRNDNGIVRPPSGMSGPPGVYAPARGEPRKPGGGSATSNNGNSGNNGSNDNAKSNGSGGGVKRSSSGSSSGSSSNDSGSKDSGSSGTTGKSTDNSSGGVHRRP